MDKTEKLRKQAQELRAGGCAYSEIASRLKISRVLVGWLFNPEQHEAAKERARLRQRERNLALKNRDLNSAYPDKARQIEELEARLAEIPEDTRSKTGRLMGDPIPGRRALDMRRAA